MELYFNLFKVKYVKLLDLFRADTSINIALKDTVNVFINLEPIYTKMCNPTVNDYLKVKGKTAHIEFIACVINLAAHYKWFFTKNKIKSRIYLYFPSLSLSQHKNRVFNKEYRRVFEYKFTEDVGNHLLYKMITSTIPFIETIMEYIQGVYYLDSNNIENSLIPEIINKANNDNAINFIVSNSLYDWQYVNKGFHIIIPKRDDSVVVSKHTAMELLYDLNNIEGSFSLAPKIFPFLISIVGSKNRNIYNVKGVGMKTAIKLLQSAVDNKLITNEITNIHLLLEVIKPGWRDLILTNYYCTDIDSQYNQLKSKDIYDITSQIRDRFDNVSLKKINDKYFTHHPIQLMEITAEPTGGMQIFKK